VRAERTPRRASVGEPLRRHDGRSGYSGSGVGGGTSGFRGSGGSG
jgi:hypothetical protein